MNRTASECARSAASTRLLVERDDPAVVGRRRDV
jgi:hypothetical protein